MGKSLTDPFLQNPSPDAVTVVWFTNFQGSKHELLFGKELEQRLDASSTKLSRMREDQDSFVADQWGDARLFTTPAQREVWRHQVTVTSLKPGERLPYKVISLTEKAESVESAVFSLSSLPKKGQPLSILLTSDHQLMPLTALNLQKASELTHRFDAVFYAGDAVMVPDRASEWFDDIRGSSFFACLQGNAKVTIQDTVVAGAPIIQHCPIYTAVGNHEVMGRYNKGSSLLQQFEASYPQELAKRLQPELSEDALADASFNTTSYQEIFSLPETGSHGYYSVAFGDVYLIVLNAACMWRTPEQHANVAGKYHEALEHLADPDSWGCGQIIFEPILKGSKQYQWLEAQLKTEAFATAAYRIVMLHHPLHSLGGNSVPAFTEPIPRFSYHEDKTLKSIRYDYPKDQDYLIRDIEPLLEASGVHLVLQGHTHVWNRFKSPAGVNYLETSHVGNSYGAFWQQERPDLPEGSDYIATGDPNGLEPIVPSLLPFYNDESQALPFVAQPQLSVFSILDTADGCVRSYFIDSSQAEMPAVLFDVFSVVA